MRRDKHSPTTQKDSTVPSSYSVQQLKTVVAPLSLPLLTLPHFLSLSEPVSPHQLSLSSVSQIQNLPLSAPARSLCLPCQPPTPLSLSSSLFLRPPPPLASVPVTLPRLLTRFLSFLPLSIAVFLCLFYLPLTLFFASPTRSLLSLYPQPSVLLLCPCLLISSVSSPVLLLSRPDSLTPPPSYFSACVTPANFPLPSASLSCRSPSLSLFFCSLSPCR